MIRKYGLQCMHSLTACICYFQVEKEEKEAQERAIVQKEEVAAPEPWAGDAPAPEVSDWASESVPVSSVPVQPFGTAAAAVAAPAAATEDWSMPAKDEWSTPAQAAATAPTTESWGGGSSETWG